MEKFMIIGERIHCISPAIKKAISEKDPAPILQRAKEQIDAGATYIDVNIGPAEKNGEEIMKWAVQLIQSECNNIPLVLDTANKKAIEAGISVYNRSFGKPIVNSADAGGRIDNINLAAANDAMVIALCADEGIPKDNEERMNYAQLMIERGLEAGMDVEDMIFDPLFLVVKGMQDQIPELFDGIRMLSDMGLKTTGGLSNISNGAPKALRPIIDAYTMAMCIQCGLTSAIINPCDKQLMEAIRTCEMLLGATLYADSYLEL